MSAQVVQPKTWRDEVWEYRGFLKFVSQVAILLIAAVAWALSLSAIFFPDVKIKVSNYPLPYLPTQYKLVEEVRNALVTTLPIGLRGEAVVSVGFPEVVISVQEYRSSERKGVTHFLDLSLDSVDSTTLHYYDLQDNLVLHASHTIEAPSWGRLGIVFGYFQAYSGRIETGTLVLDRKYILDWNWLGIPVVGYSVLFFILWLAVAISGNYYFIKPFLFWLRSGTWGSAKLYYQYGNQYYHYRDT